jgi:hypothetical protein
LDLRVIERVEVEEDFGDDDGFGDDGDDNFGDDSVSDFGLLLLL